MKNKTEWVQKLKQFGVSSLGKAAVALGVFTVLVIGVVFTLPVVPYGLHGGGVMGGGGMAPAIVPEPPYPLDQPTTVPVYKVVDYVTLRRGLNWSFTNPDGPTPTEGQVLQWLPEMLRRDYQLPLPEDKYLTYPYGTEESHHTAGIGYTQKVHGYEVFPSEISASFGPDGELSDLGYRWVWVEKVGDIPVMSAQEAYQHLKRGKDIEPKSRDGVTHRPLTGWDRIPYHQVVFEYYYPPGAEPSKPHTGQYLIPAWLFCHLERRTYSSGLVEDIPSMCGMINAVDASVDVAWSPENSQGFVPNDRFAALKNTKATRWVHGYTFKEDNVPRQAFDHLNRTYSYST